MSIIISSFQHCIRSVVQHRGTSKRKKIFKKCEKRNQLSSFTGNVIIYIEPVAFLYISNRWLYDVVFLNTPFKALMKVFINITK